MSQSQMYCISIAVIIYTNRKNHSEIQVCFKTNCMCQQQCACCCLLNLCTGDMYDFHSPTHPRSVAWMAPPQLQLFHASQHGSCRAAEKRNKGWDCVGGLFCFFGCQLEFDVTYLYHTPVCFPDHCVRVCVDVEETRSQLPHSSAFGCLCSHQATILAPASAHMFCVWHKHSFSSQSS